MFWEQGRNHGLKSGGRIMANARNDAQKGWSAGRGCPLPTGGGGYALFAEFFFISELKMASFGAYFGL